MQDMLGGSLMLTVDEEVEKNMVLYRDRLSNLLDRPTYEFSRSDRRDIPDVPGVYIIYDKTAKQILYVGESDNVRRRLFGDHRSGNRRGSAFRRALSRWRKMEDEKEIREYIIQNCSFQVLPVPDKLRRKRFEHFAIAVLSPLLNDVVKLKIV